MLDAIFYPPGVSLDGEPCEYKPLVEALEAISGVLAVGLLPNRADAAVVAQREGARLLQRTLATGKEEEDPTTLD